MYKTITMKINILNYFFLLGIGILISCGKPNVADSLNPSNGNPANSGGYKIEKIYTTSGYAQDVLQKDNLLYIAQGEGGLEIVDVSNPLDPQTVSVTTHGVKGYSDKISMKDSVVYLAAGTFGINVINVADPLMPEVTVANLSMKPAKNTFIYGKYMYAAISEQGVGIADVSYPPHPDIRGTVYTPGYANDIMVSSDTNRLFVACGEMGFSIINISQIVEGYGVFWQMGWCDTPGYAEDLVVLEDQSLAFLACGTYGLQVIDFSDTTNIQIVGSFDGGGYAKELVYKDQTIYMTAELSGLQVIDVSDITNPFLIGSVDTDYALGLTVDDKYVYIADEDMGLIVISKPK